MKIIGIVECNENGYYSISSISKIGNFCIAGFGNSAEQAKNDFLDVIKEAQEDYAAEHGNLPKKYRDIVVEYKYDLQFFFNYFNWINISKFAKASGINESNMRLYKVGKAFASEKTKAKIRAALDKMIAELSSASL